MNVIVKVLESNVILHKIRVSFFLICNSSKHRKQAPTVEGKHPLSQVSLVKTESHSLSHTRTKAQRHNIKHLEHCEKIYALYLFFISVGYG